MAEKVDYLLIGGGLASAKCARTLREQGAQGRVLIVGREPDPPYNRPDCSKGFLRGEQDRAASYVDEQAFYAEAHIELLTKTSVVKLDPQAHTVKLSNKQEIKYGKALLATGANVKRLPVEGCELSQIHYLRTLGNAEAIKAAVTGAEEVVLIGGSYIGCEVAASLTMLGVHCTIVMQEHLTLERGFGQEAARFFHQLLRSHGVTIHGDDALQRFEGDEKVRNVITQSGLRLPADAVVIGAGVSPDVQLARAAGLTLGPSGGVKCDSRLASSAPDVYAAGDVCEYDSMLHGAPLRIEHWDVAFNHGATAAKNMLGADVAHEEVPYFFSVLGDWAELEYVGPAFSWDQELLRGSAEEASFTRWYLEGGRVKAALTVGRPDDLDHAKRLMRSRVQLHSGAQAILTNVDAELAAVQ